jgi:hypothetical protein
MEEDLTNKDVLLKTTPSKISELSVIELRKLLESYNVDYDDAKKNDGKYLSVLVKNLRTKLRMETVGSGVISPFSDSKSKTEVKRETETTEKVEPKNQQTQVSFLQARTTFIKPIIEPKVLPMLSLSPYYQPRQPSQPSLPIPKEYKPASENQSTSDAIVEIVATTNKKVESKSRAPKSNTKTRTRSSKKIKSDE